jgi:GTP-binding protein Era
MVAAAWAGAGEADLIALIVDASDRVPGMFDEIARALAKLAPPKVLILNKVDAVKRESLLALSARLNEKLAFQRTFMVSALRGDGVEDFLSYCTQTMPSGPWHFPEDQLTDLSLALTAAEVTREKLFLKTHQEIPYSATVEPEKFETREDGSYVIHQVIVVAREAHKKIVVGKGGQAIRAIGEAARKELEGIFEAKVHLFLFVKVRENWADDPARYAEMGLEFPH